jgi:ureidoglycolate lyase
MESWSWFDMKVLTPGPLTAEGFAPFGEVIETATSNNTAMNAGRFQRFDELATVVCTPVPKVSPQVGIVRCASPTPLPYEFDMVERHPLSSQAFVPLTQFCFVIVVGAAIQVVGAAGLSAFVTNGQQGINYHPGTWHLPLIAFERGQEFLVIDFPSIDNNCDEFRFAEPIELELGALSP